MGPGNAAAPLYYSTHPAAFDWKHFDSTKWRGCTDDVWLERCFPLQRPHAFIYRHVAFAGSVTDAERTFHVSNALALLSACVPAHVVIPTQPRVPLNIYTTLIGPTYESHKTTAILLATGLLNGVKPELAMTTRSSSAEDLVDTVIANPQRLIYATEGGTFLGASTGSTGPGPKIREAYNELYDGTIQARSSVEKTRERKRKSMRPEDEALPQAIEPRISLTFGCTDHHVWTYTDFRDWTTGFMRRLHLNVVLKKTRVSRQSVNRNAEEVLKAHLRRLLEYRAYGYCEGLTPDAEQMLAGWAATLPRVEQGVPEVGAGVVLAAEAHALRVGALFAFDRHTADYAAGRSEDTEQLRQPFQITVEDILPAMHFANMHVCSAWYLARNVASNEHGQTMNKILEMAAEGPQHRVERARVLQKLQLPAKTADMYIETLVEQERLVRHGGKGFSQNGKGSPNRGVVLEMVEHVPWDVNVLVEGGFTASGTGSSATEVPGAAPLAPAAPFDAWGSGYKPPY